MRLRSNDTSDIGVDFDVEADEARGYCKNCDEWGDREDIKSVQESVSSRAKYMYSIGCKVEEISMSKRSRMMAKEGNRRGYL